MKRIVCTLLMAIAMTTSFAQTTLDYVQKAKAGLTQYYPQFKDYFEPIFKSYYEKISSSTRNIVNSKIQENLEIFEEEIATDRDKCATILTSLDILMGEKKFRNSKKQIDSKEGEYAINEVASEIAGDINNQMKKEIQKETQKVREETQKVREETQKVQEETQKLRDRNEIMRDIINIMNNSTKSRETTEKIVIKMDEYFGLFDVSEIKGNSGLQKVIKDYINLNKQINRRPSTIGQKFIDEYNR